VLNAHEAKPKERQRHMRRYLQSLFLTFAMLVACFSLGSNYGFSSVHSLSPVGPLDGARVVAVETNLPDGASRDAGTRGSHGHTWFQRRLHLETEGLGEFFSTSVPCNSDWFKGRGAALLLEAPKQGPPKASA